MLNIKTLYGAVRYVPNQETAILVCSLHRVERLGIPFVFTKSARVSNGR